MRHTSIALKKVIPLYKGNTPVRKQFDKTLPESREDVGEYYSRRIHELQLELQKLNFLEHPLRIVEICNQIQDLKNKKSNLEN